MTCVFFVSRPLILAFPLLKPDKREPERSTGQKIMPFCGYYSEPNHESCCYYSFRWS